MARVDAIVLGAGIVGTEHDGIDARHGVPSQTYAPPACTRAAPTLATC